MLNQCFLFKNKRMHCETPTILKTNFPDFSKGLTPHHPNSKLTKFYQGAILSSQKHATFRNDFISKGSMLCNTDSFCKKKKKNKTTDKPGLRYSVRQHCYSFHNVSNKGPFALDAWFLHFDPDKIP